jgi:hypothetical protein
MNKRPLMNLLGKAAIAAFVIIAAVSYLTGCSNDSGTTTGSPDQATVVTGTSMQQGAVTSAAPAKSSGIMGNKPTADSIVITRARIVIRTLKLHVVGDADDTIPHQEHNGDKDVIKAGPFLAEFNVSGQKIISTVTIPPGTYDRIKFEIHKLNENEDPSLLNDPIFGDFVNGGRYTFIIDGFAYLNGVAYPFSFKSSQTDNVEVFLNSPALYDATHVYDLTIIFDPKLMFGRAGQRPLDPRDVDNQKDIEKLLKSSIKLLNTKR